MVRNPKLMALAVGVVAALVGATLFIGGAQATTWHDYEGDVFAGHAYGLMVPEGAKSVEVLYEGAGAARLSMLAPDGSKIGYYELTSALAAASIAQPTAGRHVLYVYDVTDGALRLRVDSEQAPTLALQKMRLVRADVDLVEQDAPAALDKLVTAQLDAAPVFATLLYEGSARGLDATVSSEKGPVVTIVDESGTAFSPGVWSSLSGTRTSEPGNLAGTAYTVELHADSFEGRLVLAALSVDLHATAPEVPKTPDVPEPPLDLGATFALDEGAAVAFDAPAGTLRLVDGPAYEAWTRAAEPDDEEADDNASHDDEAWTSRHYHGRSLIALYDPADALVALVELDEDTPVAEIELVAAGEYVAFVHRASDESVYAAIDGASAAPPVRQLALVEETFELQADAMGEAEAAAFDLTRAPVAMRLAYGEGVGALSWAEVANENGRVAHASSFVTASGAHLGSWGGSAPENFAAGAHTLHVSGAYEGSLVLVATAYDRTLSAAALDEADDEADEDSGEGTALPFRLPL